MKTTRVEVRVDATEKVAFEEAASLVGLKLSSWMRLRLRQAATLEFESASRPVPFSRKLEG